MVDKHFNRIQNQKAVGQTAPRKQQLGATQTVFVPELESSNI